MPDFFQAPNWPSSTSYLSSSLTSRYPESSDQKKTQSNGYTSKVRVLDRYKVVGFISSGTYGRVYKAVGHNGQSGDFAIKKCVLHVQYNWHTMLIIISGLSQTKKVR